MTINWKAVPTLAWVGLAALVFLLALLWYVHWSGERQGAARAEEQRLLASAASALVARDDSTRLLKAQQTKQVIVDQKATVAHAHAVVAHSRVRVLSKDTLRVTTDTGAILVPVPQEVTGVLIADSTLIAARDSQIVVRDTVIARAVGVIAADSIVLVRKDSVITAVRASKSDGTLKTVALTVVGTLATLLALVHFLR